KAKEVQIHDSRLSEMLDKADRVVAFYDRTHNFIIAPRASLFKDTEVREIVSGVIRHEVVHRENESRYSASENEFRALASQRDFYAKRGISFYLQDGLLVAEKQDAQVVSASDFELREYVYNNPNEESLGIFTVDGGKRKKLTAQQKKATVDVMQLVATDTSPDVNSATLKAINQKLSSANSVYDLKQLVSEALDISVGNDAQARQAVLRERWGLTEEHLLSLDSWLKLKLSKHANIEILKEEFLIELDDRKIDKLKLIYNFEQLETELGKLLAEKRTREITQDTLDLLGDVYEVDSAVGERICPASFNVNTQLGGFTDLPPHGQFESIVKNVRIHNVLDANCLRELDGYGEAGEVARVAVLDLIWCDVKARLAATKIRHRQVVHSGNRQQIWNDLATPKTVWSSEDLVALLDKLEKSDVFKQEIADERFGLPRTSVTKNQDMHARKWSTDACIGGGLAQREVPSQSHLWMRNMITNAGFILHPSNIQAATRSIEDPNWFRDGDASKGIAHIFLDSPKNLQGEGLVWDEANQVPLIESIVPDPAWFNCKRLESQALLLSNLVETIVAGACYSESRSNLAEKGKVWGFNWSGDKNFPDKNTTLTEKQKEYVISSIQVLASYLLSVQWDGKAYDMKAPTVSSWEEAPRAGGCASDTGFMEDAISMLQDLLFNPAYEGNAVIADVRERLNNKLPQFSDNRNGVQFLNEHPYADFRKAENLKAFCDSSELLLSEMVIAPINATIAGRSVSTPLGVMQYRDRKPDTSLTLLAAYHRRFDGSLGRNARMRYGLVRAAKDQLMDDHYRERFGMRRYAAFFAEDSQQWIVDSYMMREFDMGLIVPALVRPGYAKRIAREFANISPYLEERKRKGTASSRDMLVEEGYNRFFERSGEPLVAKKDATTTECMAGRQQFSLPEWAAQWTIGPTAAVIALAKAKLEIVEYLKTTSAPYETRVLDLLAWVDKDLTDFINLCLSTIVQNTDAEGREVLRADGTPLPDQYNTMEAFVVVPDVEGNDVWMPGAHTLTWSSAQFHYGLKLAAQAARILKRFPGLS
nr:hypothetical protein [Pseudomonadota bacterium]